MGCFNTTGFHSNLPIVCGDKIFSIICLRWNEFDDDFLRFGPGYQITPIFLPIFGEYNDYGNIENIERTPEVESIERMFGYNIDDIMEAIQNIMWGHDNIGKNSTMCKQIKSFLENDLNINEDKFTICYTMDHRFVYENLATLPHYMDIKHLLDSKSWELTKEYLLDDYKTWKDKQDAEEKEYLDYFDWKRDLQKIVQEKRFTSLNPNLNGHEFGWLFNCNSEYYLSEYLLFPYKKYVKDLFEDNMKTPYLKFICFFIAFKAYDWEFTLNIFGGQNRQHGEILSLYRQYVDFLENKLIDENYDDE